MRTTLASVLSAALVAGAVFAAPAAYAQTEEAETQSSAEGGSSSKAKDEDGGKKQNTPAEGQEEATQLGSSEPDYSKNVPPRPTLGAPAPALEPLNPAPYTDPMYIDPDKNPFKKISSSELFLDWTNDMPEGKGKDFVQAWAIGSAIPDTANPAELMKQEIQGSAMMSSGLFTGDFPQSSRGSSQASSVILPVMLGVFVVGQVLELIMRGFRAAGVQLPQLSF